MKARKYGRCVRFGRQKKNNRTYTLKQERSAAEEEGESKERIGSEGRVTNLVLKLGALGI